MSVRLTQSVSANHAEAAARNGALRRRLRRSYASSLSSANVSSPCSPDPAHVLCCCGAWLPVARHPLAEPRSAQSAGSAAQASCALCADVCIDSRIWTRGSLRPPMETCAEETPWCSEPNLVRDGRDLWPRESCSSAVGKACAGGRRGLPGRLGIHGAGRAAPARLARAVRS